MEPISSYSHLKIGVLALQGAFSKHIQKVSSLGAHCIEVLHPEQLSECHGLIIPGGESTTLAKELSKNGWSSKLLAFSHRAPFFATCAGLILFSTHIIDYPELRVLPLFPVTVERNSYGRQLHSFQTHLTLENDPTPLPAIFIRAPKISHWKKEVKIEAAYQGTPQLISYNHHLASTFHPELTPDSRIHARFLNRCLKQYLPLTGQSLDIMSLSP